MFTGFLSRRIAGVLIVSVCLAGGCGPDSNEPSAESLAQAGRMEQAAAENTPWQGRDAPDFALPDQNGRRRRLSDQRGQWVVLYFYPEDDTPGCTCQATEFTELLFQFEQLGATVWGVSDDSVASHRRFAEKHELAITLLSDTDRRVMRAYDAWMDYSGSGGRTVRTTFLIGPDGKVRRHWPEVIPQGHARRVQQALAEMQNAQEVAGPWGRGEIPAGPGRTVTLLGNGADSPCHRTHN
jgi:peroxiredoxin Q/BCP